MNRYPRIHFPALQETADVIAHRRAEELSQLDREREYPDVNPANFAEAMAYQAQRYRVHLDEFEHRLGVCA